MSLRFRQSPEERRCLPQRVWKMLKCGTEPIHWARAAGNSGVMLAVLIRRSEWGLWNYSTIPGSLYTGIIGVRRMPCSAGRAEELR